MRLPSSSALLIGSRAVLGIALVFTFASAVMPPSHAPRLFPWDKAEHFTAFYVLGCLAAAAFPRRTLIVLALGLSLFGCAIELAQALPFVHRDCDIMDWLADVAGICGAFAPTILANWRARDWTAQGWGTR